MDCLANQIWSTTSNASLHPLSKLVDVSPAPDDDSYAGIIPAKLDMSITAPLPPRITVTLLCYVNVYVNDFIALSQGGHADRHRVCNHIFHTIDKVFRHSAPGYPTQQEFNSLKKIQKGDMAWT